MIIQLEKLWLFEASIVDPFFIGEKDGLTTKMLDARTIEFLNIANITYLMNQSVKAGFTYSMKYGGEDSDMTESLGKHLSNYSLEFNVPTKSQKSLEQMVGKQFSFMGMRRDLSHFIIFAQLEVDELSVDNYTQQRVTFKSKNTNAKMYDVLSFNAENVDDSIDECDFNSDNNGGFDYSLDWQFD